MIIRGRILMAKNTDIALRNEVIYCIYVRNHTKEGNFKAIEKDLQRIKDLGCNIIWFMPIHPIGQVNKKGKLGSPYAIKNYREINPQYGTKKDFINLVDKIHEMDMKCIIDVVYNHTSPDSDLVKSHPEYFYKKADGSRGNRVGDWSDIVDLDYSNKQLWDYQIETLKQWAEIVDGFRCDVASFVPIEFWEKARKETSKVKENLIWLAESADLEFLQEMRKLGFDVWSDGELYSAFDITYDYDIWQIYNNYLFGKIKLSEYINFLNFQDGIYPTNYVKMRCLENHDRPRIKSLVQGENVLENFTAFLYFQKGITLIYGGQEFENKHTPSLFDKDEIKRNNNLSMSKLMKKLSEIKRNEVFAKGIYKLTSYKENVIGYYKQSDKTIIGIFNLKGKSDKISVNLKDGIYTNEINNEKLKIENGTLNTNGYPIIISI